MVYVGNFDDDKRSGRVDELAVGPAKEVVFRGQLNANEQIDCAYGTLDIDTTYVTALDDPVAVESAHIKYKKLQGKVTYSGAFSAN